MAPRVAAGENVAILFGRERNGLENDEVALADAHRDASGQSGFRFAQSGAGRRDVAYEWFKLACGGKLPFGMPNKSAPAPKQQLLAFFAAIERELEKVEFFRPPDKRDTMQINLRNIFTRMQPTRQDIQTLHGVIMAIAEGRKGPARGGVLDGEQAEMLRALLAEHGGGRVPKERGPVRGLARLLRRNPTEAERALWTALINDRRFAGRGFKRQTPVGQHICDFVSFPLRLVIDLVPARGERGRGRGAGAKARLACRTRLSHCRDRRQRRWRQIWRPRWTGSRGRSALEHLHRRRGAGAQHGKVARHSEEFHAALGQRHGALGGMTIGAWEFLHALRRRDQRVELAFDIVRQWIEGFSLRQRDRQIGGAEEKAVDAGCAIMASKFCKRGPGLDHRERDDMVIGLAQIDRLIGQSRPASWRDAGPSCARRSAETWPRRRRRARRPAY